MPPRHRRLSHECCCTTAIFDMRRRADVPTRSRAEGDFRSRERWEQPCSAEIAGGEPPVQIPGWKESARMSRPWPRVSVVAEIVYGAEHLMNRHVSLPVRYGVAVRRSSRGVSEIPTGIADLGFMLSGGASTPVSELILECGRFPATFPLALSVSMHTCAYGRLPQGCGGSQNASEMAHGDTPELRN